MTDHDEFDLNDIITTVLTEGDELDAEDDTDDTCVYQPSWGGSSTRTNDEFDADQTEPPVFAPLMLEPELVDHEDITQTDAPEVAADPVVSPKENDGVYGNAVAWHDDWFHQVVDGFCGPSSVAFILNSFFNAGIFDPNTLVNQALELGIDDNLTDGMTVFQIEQLMEANGVEATIEWALSNDPMQELANKLAAGHGVIGIVDGHEMWALFDLQAAQLADFESDVPNHALVVTEINMNDGTVTLADPGHPLGNGMIVSLDVFREAWEDSNFQMLVTDGTNDELKDPALQAVGTNFVLVNASGSDRI